MSAVVKTVKVSSKGQITLPREVRKSLGTDHVRIVLEAGSVRIEPVNDVAGSLAHYAKGRKRVAFHVARKQAWEAVVREKRKRR
ncbi:MAG: AbrB/MazE/SpoVT family DNA-binding domain-containing protein [Pseudomonadota bacterium]